MIYQEITNVLSPFGDMDVCTMANSPIIFETANFSLDQSDAN